MAQTSTADVASAPKATSPPPAPKAKTKTSTRKTRVATPEKYDLSRRTGPDGRDSRAQGFPCFGNHTEMPEGRGSLSGRNAHGKWTVCSTCRLRLEYVPAYGATGIHRQAGPLPPDVETVMNVVKEDVKEKPHVREALNSKAASIQGAEASMRSRLEKLENDRKQVLTKAVNRPEPKTALTPPTVDLTGDQLMKLHLARRQPSVRTRRRRRWQRQTSGQWCPKLRIHHPSND